MCLPLFVLIGISPAAVAKADVYLINTSNFAENQNFGTITTALVGNRIKVDVQLTAGFVPHGQGVGFNVINPDGTAATGFAASVTRQGPQPTPEPASASAWW